MKALGLVFSKQKSLKVVSVFQNGSKEGLTDLLWSLILCKNTLTYVDISDNKSINEAIP